MSKFEGLSPEMEEKVNHTLFIDLSNSSCGNCGKQTLPDGNTHDKVSGYGGGQPGCGVEWRYVSSNYVGPRIDLAVKRNRPDLEWWPITELAKDKA